VAPADGFLRELHARPGDRVPAGQALAELAQDDLRLEQRKWESELIQHENAAAAALARSDRAQFAVSQARAEEARAQLDLAAGQLARTRILAPFDGIIIAGDLTQSLGAPVRRGETLLTIAPEHRFRLVVEVDERDIADVRVGQPGRLALGAFAGRSLPFRIARITPMATARDGRNFFEVEGELEDLDTDLRPGLQGVAKIEAGEHPAAWIWSRRVVNWLRLAAWSWGA
jgi:RND family efflux transporter MFP subunit